MREKERIVRGLMAAALKGKELHQVRLATLGGEGLEARIWREKGLPPENGWLIDLSPAVIRRLANVFREASYHLVQGRLGTFLAHLRNAEGRKPGLDLMHLDFCGTIEPVMSELSGIVEAVHASEQRILALTVSDQRRHPATDAPKEVMTLVEDVFGERAEHLVQALEAQGRGLRQIGWTPGRPRDFALREISTLLTLFLSQLIAPRLKIAAEQRYARMGKLWKRELSEKRPLIYPVSLERYTYTSRGFRMRTYVWRLEPKRGSVRSALDSFLRAWLDAPCYAVVAGESEPILVKPRKTEPRPQRKKDAAMPSPPTLTMEDAKQRLQQAMPFMSPEIRESCEVLIKGSAAIDLDPIIERVTTDVMGKMLGALTAGLGTKRVATPKAVTATPPKEVRPVPAPAPAPKRSKRKGHRDDDEISQMDDLRLLMLEAKVRGEDELAKTKEDLSKAHFPRQKKRLLRIGTVFARCQGKHRPQFVARVLLRDGGMAEKLAKLYGVTADELRAEATRH